VKEFKQVRENLLDMLEDIDQRLSKITDDSNEIDKTATKDLSIKIDKQDSIVRDIDNIKLAISQIDSGTYGICLNCGQPIKKEYLNLDPLSNYCVHCADDKN